MYSLRTLRSSHSLFSFHLSSFHSLCEYFLSTYYVPGAMQCTVNMALQAQTLLRAFALTVSSASPTSLTCSYLLVILWGLLKYHSYPRQAFPDPAIKSRHRSSAAFPPTHLFCFLHSTYHTKKSSCLLLTYGFIICDSSKNPMSVYHLYRRLHWGHSSGQLDKVPPFWIIAPS